jgi:hypothetical protein
MASDDCVKVFRVWSNAAEVMDLRRPVDSFGRLVAYQRMNEENVYNLTSGME